MERKQDGVRIWELDFFRGIALFFMIYFHIIFDLKEFFGYPVSYGSGFNYLTGKFAVILFTLISGISCFLSRSNAKRGLKILGFGLIISLATHLYDPAFGVKFGVLHFLGTSILLYPLFKKLDRFLLLILGTGIIFLGNYLNRINAANDYFFILGITSNNFISSDYYPLLPWFSIFLYGIALGKILYSQKRSIFSFTLGKNIVSLAGRNTLPIYLVHQPVILAVLWALGMLL